MNSSGIYRIALWGGAIILLPMMLFPQIPYLPGWPQAIQAPTGRPIYIADIDDDGQNELLMMSIGNNFQDDMLYAFKGDGTVITGFPISGGAFFSGDPALFDSDDDGKLEIAVAQDGNLYLRDQQGNALWTIPYSGPVFQSLYYPFHVSVEDLDNDGLKEIILTCYAGGAVFVFDAQGNVRPGWPVLIPPKPPYTGPPPISMSTSIADIDQDGLRELIFGTSQGQFYCLKPDGSICSGFPLSPPGVVSGYGYKPILYDLNGDGFLEILIPDSPTFTFRVYDYLANVLQSIALTTMPLSFGDPDGDGVMDVGFKAQGGYHLFETSGFTEHPNFPVDLTGGPYNGWHISNCAFADLNGDSAQELLSGSACCGFVADGRMFALDMNGAIVPDFPTSVLYHRGTAYKYSAVNDLDQDGDLEFCVGSTNDEFVVPRSSTVYCWTTSHPYNLDNIDWAMDGFDLGHTGRWRRLYHINKISSQLTVASGQCEAQGNPCYLPPNGNLIPVTVTAVRQFGGANPAGQDVRYSRTMGCGNYEGPVVDHGDGTYTRMLRAPTADCTTDVHAWVNEFKLQDCQQIFFTNSCFQPPDAFNLLSPANGAFNQPPTVTFTWPAVGSFPNQATSYDLYFGASTTPPLLASGLTTTQYTVSGLSPKTRYYWKVVAKNACGETPSPVWCFMTASCTAAPQSFNNLSPANGATGVPLPVDLTWSASSGAAQYDVYLGADPASLALVSTVYKPQATLTGLSYRKTYYWRIVAKNPCGSTSGPLWSFTTRLPFPKPVPTLATAAEGGAQLR